MQEESNEGRGEGSGLNEFRPCGTSHGAASAADAPSVGATKKVIHNSDDGSNSQPSLIETLHSHGIREELHSKLLYGLALARNPLIDERTGLERIRRYVRSTGRYGHNQGAFLAPLFGLGDLCQAFCRSAAVKGAVHCLRCQLTSVQRNPQDDRGVDDCAGSNARALHVTTDSGQTIACDGIICSQLVVPSFVQVIDATQQEWVARGFIVLSGSAFGTSSQAIATFEPHSLPYGNTDAIRALQLGSTAGVCPDGMYVLHLACVSSTSASAYEQLQPAVDLLLSQHASSEASILWGMYYKQRRLKQVISTAGSDLHTRGMVVVPSPDDSFGTVDDAEHARTALSITLPDVDFLSTEPMELSSEAAVESERERVEEMHAFNSLARAINNTPATDA